MRSFPRASRIAPIALGAVGIAFPFLVYFGLQVLPPAALALGLLSLLALRLLRDQSRIPGWLAPLCWIALASLAVAAAWVPVAAMTAYPILFSLGLAAIFAHSLIQGPPVIEKIARLREPILPDAVVRYTRGVTIVWLAFFLFNSAASAATAIAGDLQIWTLYNGFISYVLMGGLFAAEFAVRSYLRRRPRVVP